MADIIRESKLRIGNFTSSKINKLRATGPGGKWPGKPASTYIKERNWERQLDLPLTVETSNHPFSWGKACEVRIFELMDSSYIPMSTETLQHPKIEYWTGSPDAKKEFMGKATTCVEFKCPITRASYMKFYNSKDIFEAIEEHDDAEDYFWQTNSNAILLDAEECELIIYMPYLSELPEIREIAQEMPPDVLYNFFWIFNANDEELPYLKDLEQGGKVEHIKKFTWKLTQEMKAELTATVEMAGKLLIPR